MIENKVEVNKTFAMGNPYYYRNKLQFPVGLDKNGEPVIGVYANRTHEIIPIKECAIQDQKSTKIAKYIIEIIKKYAFKINEEMKKFFISINVKLIDFKLEFGKLADNKIVLADEISPDTCRFWDATTNEKLDKDRFRRDLGNVEGAYKEMMKRILG